MMILGFVIGYLMMVTWSDSSSGQSSAVTGRAVGQTVTL